MLGKDQNSSIEGTEYKLWEGNKKKLMKLDENLEMLLVLVYVLHPLLSNLSENLSKFLKIKEN